MTSMVLGDSTLESLNTKCECTYYSEGSQVLAHYFGGWGGEVLFIHLFLLLFEGIESSSRDL